MDQRIARADHDIKSLSPATKFCLKVLSPATKTSTQLGVRHMRHMRHAHVSTPAFLRCKIKNENKIFCQYVSLAARGSIGLANEVRLLTAEKLQ
eukprot:SAG25_NODE_1769_length_2368_cov_28.217276_1_plen_94_part_00